jgi:hypothetical protein
MTTEDVPNQATKSQRETLLSVLCTKEDWTPNEATAYKALAFREDGVGCVSYTTMTHAASHPTLLIFCRQLKLFNDQPGSLLVCEFDWEIDNYDAQKAKAETIINTYQKDLEDSLRTRQVAKFNLTIKLRNCEPREEFGDFGTLDLKASLLRRLKETAFEEEEDLLVDLEVGNFPPDYDTNSPNSDAFGQTRWGLRLSFRYKSPIPALDKWHEDYHNMVESQFWESETNWFSRKLRGRSTDGWTFKTG